MQTVPCLGQSRMQRPADDRCVCCLQFLLCLMCGGKKQVIFLKALEIMHDPRAIHSQVLQDYCKYAESVVGSWGCKADGHRCVYELAFFSVPEPILCNLKIYKRKETGGA